MSKTVEFLTNLLPGKLPSGAAKDGSWGAFDRLVATWPQDLLSREARSLALEVLRLRFELANTETAEAKLSKAQGDAVLEEQTNNSDQSLGDATPPQCECGGVPSVELREARNRIAQLSAALGKPLEGADFPMTVPKDKQIYADELGYYVQEIKSAKALLSYTRVPDEGSLANRFTWLAKKWFAYHEISSQDQISAAMRGILRDTGHTSWMAARDNPIVVSQTNGKADENE